MTSSKLFDKYEKSAIRAGRGSVEYAYLQLLRTARVIVDRAKFESLLEEAEQTGKRLELVYPIPINMGASEPSDVRLV